MEHNRINGAEEDAIVVGRNPVIHDWATAPDFDALDAELRQSEEAAQAAPPARQQEAQLIPFAVPRQVEPRTDAVPVPRPEAVAPRSPWVGAEHRASQALSALIPKLRDNRGAVLVIVLLGAVLLVALLTRGARQDAAQAADGSAPGGAAGQATGTASFESQPPGVSVTVDGVGRGVTPLTLTLPEGKHVVELGQGTRAARTLQVAIAPNVTASHYIEMPAGAVAGSAASGRLEIISDPPGADVRVDGVRRGTTPLQLASVPAGEHRIVISQGDAVVTRTVRVAAGSTASVVTTMRAAAATAGWVSIKAPFEMKILENNEVIGSTAADRVMLPAGAHTFTLVNDDVGFSTQLTVQVTASRTTAASVTVPDGTLSLNALPWAEVSIDGRSVGTTPLANLAVPIGPREVVFRHPQHGERRQVVVVKAGSPARVGMDFSQ